MKNSNFAKMLPWFAVGFTFLYFCAFMVPHRDADGEFAYRKFGLLPVLDGGRFKPMDTYARNSLMIITTRQSHYDYTTRKRYTANHWMLDCMASPSTGDPMGNLFPNGAQERPAWEYKVFRIDNEELVRFLELKWREGHSYSIAEMFGENAREKIERLEEEMARIGNIPAKDRSLIDSKLLELAQHLQLSMAISRHQTPRIVPDGERGDQWSPFRFAVAELFGLKEARRLREAAQKEEPDADRQMRPETEAAAEFYYQLFRHYDNGDKDEFNRLLDRHLATLEKNSPALMKRMRTEVFFNEFAPFFWCLVAYALIAVVTAFTWLSPAWCRPIQRAAFASMGVVFIVHTAGLILRMYLQDRPGVFVTNLYSSAIFIGWGCVAVSMIAEGFYRNGIAIVEAGVTGFCTLWIAHILSLDGDTMIMMQAVLDTNFWLATHVTCVTLGYTMAFVAGALGIGYIFTGVFTNMMRGEGGANLTRMTYGVLCGGMFLSFVGTVLGGLWADYSWGRFWGWDPKENGALLIVLWIAMILHARWGGMVKQRGLAVLSVLGIIITSWSWFGTNFLGVGLHAYGGAKSSAMMALIMIDIGFLAIAGLGMMPLEMWQSFRPPPAPPPPLKPQTAAAKAKSMAS